MYFTYRYDFALSKINQLLRTTELVLDLKNSILKKNYNAFLESQSAFSQPVSWNGSLLMDFPSLKNYSFSFYEKNKEHFCMNSKILNERIKNGFFEKGFDHLQHNIPELYDLSQFLIKAIVVNHMTSYTNGTTEETIGLSIIDFKDEFDQHDFVELIVHQVTHMLVFIMDRIEPQMSENNKTVMIPTKFKFVLGGNSFPAYLAFHSFLVAVEVLLFRHQTGTMEVERKYHGSTQRIKGIIEELETQIKKNINLFTNSGRIILEDAANSIKFLMAGQA